MAEGCKSVTLSQGQTETAADFQQLLLGLSEKGLTGMCAHIAYRESCFYLFTSSRG